MSQLALATAPTEKVEKPVTYEITDTAAMFRSKDYVLADRYDTVEEWFETSLFAPGGGDLPLVWDVETNGINPWISGFVITIFSFWHEKCKAPLVFPTHEWDLTYNSLRYDPSAYGPEFEKMMELVKIILETKKYGKVGHNIKFDENSVYAKYGIRPRGFAADTRVLAYCTDPTAFGKRGLDDLIVKYIPDAPRYWMKISEFIKEEESDDEIDYSKIPPSILIPYAAMDSMYTGLLIPHILADLEEMGEGSFVRIDDSKLSRTKTLSAIDYALHARRIHHVVCTEMEHNGMKVDRESITDIGAFYGAIETEKSKELAEDPQLKKFEEEELVLKLSKSAYTNFVRNQKKKAGIKPNTPIAKALLMLKDNPMTADDHPRINWKSTGQVRTFFVDYLKLPVVRSSEKTGDASTDANSLMEWASQGCKPAKLLLEYRKASKFMDSYIRPLQTSDGHLYAGDFLRADFRYASVRTGRLGAGRPNLQALPRSGLVKRLYTTRFGRTAKAKRGWILQRDYSGLEVRVLTLVCQEPSLVKAFNEGGDPHFVTQTHFFKENANKGNKEQRTVCKQALFGRLYGQGDKGLFDLLHEANVLSPTTGEPVTLEECAEFNHMIDMAYPAVPQWVDSAHACAVNDRKIVSAFGFTIPAPILSLYRQWKKNRWNFGEEGKQIAAALRHAQNYPIQSTASDITMFSAYRIMQQLYRQKLESKLVLIVHDSIYMDCIEEEVIEVGRIMHETMDSVPDWLGDVLPGFNTDWMRACPIIGEAEYGINAKDALVAVKEPKGEFLDAEFKRPSADPKDPDAEKQEAAITKYFGDSKKLTFVNDADAIHGYLMYQRSILK